MRGPALRAALVDSVVLLGSLGLVLTLLDESFWSRDYLVTGLAPGVVLLALAWWLRRSHEGVWIYCLLALVAYAPLGALVALRRPGPWIVPSLDTMNRVLGGTFQAPELFVSTLPPVEPSGTLMLLPYAIGFGAAMPAAWLAISTTRPIAPVVSIVAGLAATIPVAVLVPDHYILRGVVLTVVLVTWVAARARRSEGVVATQSRSALLATLVALVVVGVVSGLVTLIVPDDDQTDRVRLEPRGDSAIAAGAADTIVRPGSGRQELFRARGAPIDARLRFGALDHYDGQAWVAAEESPGAGSAGTFRRLSERIAPVHSGSRAQVRVQIRPGYVSNWLPTLGELTSLDLDYTDGRTQLKDVRYNQATSSALVVGGVDPRDDYTFTSVVTSDDLTTGDATMVATEDQRQPEGAFLDQFLLPFDRTELAPLQRVLLLARYLRQNGAVRLTGTSSQAPVDLGLRLLGARRMAATPFQYSVVAALGASRLGVPARVVVGAEPGARGVVTQQDVVSWVEIQFADGTWRTLDPERYTGVHPYAEDESEQFLGAGGWVERELDLDEGEIKIPKGADIELSPDTVIEERSDPLAALGEGLAVLLGVVLLAWLAVPIVKMGRRRRRRSADGWSGVYVGGWQEVLDAARDRGTPVPEAWSRPVQARSLGVGLDLARRADASVFAPRAAPAEDGQAFWEACQSLRRDIAADAATGRRLLAYVNPASLLAGWARGRSARSAGVEVGDEDRRAGGQQPTGA